MTCTTLIELEHESGSTVVFENCIRAEQFSTDEVGWSPLVICWLDDDGTRQQDVFNGQENTITRVSVTGGTDDE
jgi:hypothetical protein